MAGLVDQALQIVRLAVGDGMLQLGQGMLEVVELGDEFFAVGDEHVAPDLRIGRKVILEKFSTWHRWEDQTISMER